VKYLNTFKYFQILNLVQVLGTYFSRSFRTNNSSVLQHQSHSRVKTAPIDTIIVSIPKEWLDFINFLLTCFVCYIKIVFRLAYRTFFFTVCYSGLSVYV